MVVVKQPDPYAEHAVKKVKQELSAGRKRASRSMKGNKTTYKFFCLGEKVLANKSVRQCTSKPVERRLWANTILHFCAKHAVVWDDTVTNALLGWEEDNVTEDAVQVKETTA